MQQCPDKQEQLARVLYYLKQAIDISASLQLKLPLIDNLAFEYMLLNAMYQENHFLLQLGTLCEIPTTREVEVPKQMPEMSNVSLPPPMMPSF